MTERIIDFGFGASTGWLQQAAEVIWIGGAKTVEEKFKRKAIVAIVEMASSFAALGIAISEWGEGSALLFGALGYLASRPIWLEWRNQPAWRDIPNN